MSAITHSPRLVDDLVPLILDSNDHWWPQDLQRLALVSPCWLWEARRRLYAHPRVSSFRACNLLARTLSGNEPLKRLLRSLYLNPICEGALTEKEIASLEIILGLHGLPRITLGGDLAVKAERWAKALASPHCVTELHIDGYMLAWNRHVFNIYRHPSLKWDDAMSRNFHSLRKLRLSNLDLEVAPQAGPIALHELVLDNVSAEHDSLNLFAAVLHRLTVVSPTSAQTDDSVVSLVAYCSSTLEYLEYEVHRSRRDEGTIFDFPTSTSLPKLRTLIINGANAHSGSFERMGELCPNLVSLALQGRMVQMTVEEWVQGIRSGVFPCLKQLGTPLGTFGPPFRYWNEKGLANIKAACATRNIIMT
ncbi:hypothetical protein PUNSTDRAFT_94638 [Punctularia strigosozonata HHB-11173 SS5]|uniref:uncharacterized protein n=1 Tax=Punctularia strigosozonata (strain HHB-11173) TaxID=741275 RepID=UPI00044176E7|nr:uncharacterized protein PUNSTDRAFT_94638 [Punctularia strigosozonata HHB-11173 SS5]EIN13532.1 hypothetical protein PUNSTDRAFT_94638 [Punctularia strigosozonata HHB-11173 SS5]